MMPPSDTATAASGGAMPGCLDGLKVLDLSRILAGPSVTMLLGDLGAEVIKVEHPARGDDTRKWGPPYVRDRDGNDTTESAYYAAANRNKRSIAIDMAMPEGADLIRRMTARTDVLVENFKFGGLAKYGLDYASLAADFPALIYCSITGFGQTGPYAPRAGYDFLIQAMGGLMSVTGPVDGMPMKGGVALADLYAGMYASVGILSALHMRHSTGKGQHIDISLLDAQVAMLANVGVQHLVSGEEAPRLGNAHPSIVPYRVFAGSDGYLVLAVGNDRQFATWCEEAGVPELATDPRFATNTLRIKNRVALEALMEPVMAARTRDDWVTALEKIGVPCGPVNRISEVFADPHVQARDMQIDVPHPLAAGGSIPQIGNPIKMSGSAPRYTYGPPLLGEQTDAILDEVLGLDGEARAALRKTGAIR